MSERNTEKLGDLTHELNKLVAHGHDQTAYLADRLRSQPDEARLEVLSGATYAFDAAARAHAAKWALGFLSKNPDDVPALHVELLDRVLMGARDTSSSTAPVRNFAEACGRQAFAVVEKLVREAL